jgi:glycosyltransferase involved in cell wall biosynthesis
MFVINSVAADARVIKEASTLAAAGHQVSVIGMQEEGQPSRESIEGFEVVRVRLDPVPRGIAGPRRPARTLGTTGLALVLLDYYARALRVGRRLRADVYHAHDLVTLPVAWAAAGRRARLVYDAHELFTEIGRLGAFPRRAFRWMEAALIGRADRVITVNDSIAAELSRRYGVPTPLVVMNCPRTAGFRPDREASPLRRRVGLPHGVPIVLFQGMFMPHRGLENLVRAASRFARAHLVFMGWGPLLEDLRRLAGETGVTGRVHFTEGVPLADLLSFTSGADLGAIPYRNVGLNNYLTSPNKLFEYCAAGVPVVASRFPELTKVVDGLGIGLTFDPDDPADIARAVDALLEDDVALSRARENVARAAGRFTWEDESRKLLDLYASLERPA